MSICKLCDLDALCVKCININPAYCILHQCPCVPRTRPKLMKYVSDVKRMLNAGESVNKPNEQKDSPDVQDSAQKEQTDNSVDGNDANINSVDGNDADISIIDTIDSNGVHGVDANINTRYIPDINFGTDFKFQCSLHYCYNHQCRKELHGDSIRCPRETCILCNRSRDPYHGPYCTDICKICWKNHCTDSKCPDCTCESPKCFLVKESERYCSKHSIAECINCGRPGDTICQDCRCPAPACNSIKKDFACYRHECWACEKFITIDPTADLSLTYIYGYKCHIRSKQYSVQQCQEFHRQQNRCLVDYIHDGKKIFPCSYCNAPTQNKGQLTYSKPQMNLFQKARVHPLTQVFICQNCSRDHNRSCRTCKMPSIDPQCILCRGLAPVLCQYPTCYVTCDKPGSFCPLHKDFRLYKEKLFPRRFTKLLSRIRDKRCTQFIKGIIRFRQSRRHVNSYLYTICLATTMDVDHALRMAQTYEMLMAHTEETKNIICETPQSITYRMCFLPIDVVCMILERAFK